MKRVLHNFSKQRKIIGFFENISVYYYPFNFLYIKLFAAYTYILIIYEQILVLIVFPKHSQKNIFINTIDKREIINVHKK